MGEGRGAQCSPSSGSRNGKEEGLRAKDSLARKEAAGADHPGQVYADPSGAHTTPQVQAGRQMTGHEVAGGPQLGRGPGQTSGPGQRTRQAGDLGRQGIRADANRANPPASPSGSEPQRGAPAGHLHSAVAPKQEPRPGAQRD